MDEMDKDVLMDGVDWTMQDITAMPGSNGVTHAGSLAQDPSTNDSTASDDPNESDEDQADQEVVQDLRRRGLLPTGCCYDDRMKLHCNADFSSHPAHPEDPRRIEEIYKAFKRAGLVYTGPEANMASIIRDTPTKYMWRISAREATKEEILTTHTPIHYKWVQDLANMPYAQLRDLSRTMDNGRESLYLGSLSHLAANLSCGGAIDTCKHVLEGNVKNAFAVIRPPGHHAEYDQSLGFCFFNNVPVAVRVCQQDYPETCRKVLILDWDVHHGNGIQNIFYADPNVLYISIHVYRNGDFYPGAPPNPMTPDGGPQHCGSDAGLGKNVNIAWHDQGMGDGEYMAAFQKIVMPIAQEFDPDFVVISAGFDAADGDELGGCFVSPACYAHMTHMLMSLAEGRLAVCLEGGYNLKAISTSAVAVARTMMGEPPPKMKLPPINKKAAQDIAQVQAYHAPHWQCMRPGIISIPDLQDVKATRLHDVLRLAQRQQLSSKHQMTPLYIHRGNLFRTYENHVLVSPNWRSARQLLVVIHDPPQMYAQPDATDNHLELHNAFVVDPVVDYVDWAASKGFGVMDVNVPAAFPNEEDTDPYVPRSADRFFEAQLQELICYLWDNYIETSEEQTEIFFMGVGNAYLGVKLLLMNRSTSKERIAGIVNFVSGTLRHVKSDVDTDLSSWYKEHSQVYISSDHVCWKDENLARKIKKRRFGTVIRSSAPGLSQMMQTHTRDVQQWITTILEDRQSGDTTENEKTT